MTEDLEPLAEGYEVCFGRCWSCGHPFTFDPYRVPSLPVDPATNTPADVGHHEDGAVFTRQPICRSCVGRANVARAKRGAPLIVVLRGAYVDDGD